MSISTSVSEKGSRLDSGLCHKPYEQLRVHGLEFRVQGLEFKVWGSRSFLGGSQIPGKHKGIAGSI